jgi:hypothetical protein
MIGDGNSHVHERLAAESTLVGLDYRHVASFGEGAAGFTAEPAPEENEGAFGAVGITFVPADDVEDEGDSDTLYFWDERDIDKLIAYLERCKELLPGTVA